MRESVARELAALSALFISCLNFVRHCSHQSKSQLENVSSAKIFRRSRKARLWNQNLFFNSKMDILLLSFAYDNQLSLEVRLTCVISR